MFVALSSGSPENGDYAWLATMCGQSESTHTHVNVSHAPIRITTANPRGLLPLAISVMTPSNHAVVNRASSTVMLK